MPLLPYREVALKLLNTSSVNIRPTTNTSQAAVGTLLARHNGLSVGVRPAIEGQNMGGSVGNLWVPIYAPFINVEGYVAAYYLDVPPVVYVTTEEFEALLTRVQSLEAERVVVAAQSASPSLFGRLSRLLGV